MRDLGTARERGLAEVTSIGPQVLGDEDELPGSRGPAAARPLPPLPTSACWRGRRGSAGWHSRCSDCGTPRRPSGTRCRGTRAGAHGRTGVARAGRLPGFGRDAVDELHDTQGIAVAEKAVDLTEAPRQGRRRSAPTGTPPCTPSSGVTLFSSSRLVSMDSFTGEMNPQVLTMRTSASPGSAARRQPAPTSAAIIRSESTWFFAQPRLFDVERAPGPACRGRAQ